MAARKRTRRSIIKEGKAEDNTPQEEEQNEESEEEQPKRGRGRGRPKKRTKLNEDDEEEEPPKATRGRRGRAASRATSTTRKARGKKAEPEEEEGEKEEEEAPSKKPTRKVSRPGKKTEPEKEETDEEKTTVKTAARKRVVARRGKKVAPEEEEDEDEKDKLAEKKSHALAKAMSKDDKPETEDATPVEFTGYGGKSLGQRLAESSNFSAKHFVDYYPDQFSQFDWARIILNLLEHHKEQTLLSKVELSHIEKWRSAVEDEIHKILGEGVTYVANLVGTAKFKSTLFNVRGKDQNLTDLKDILRNIDRIITNHNNSPSENVHTMKTLRERRDAAEEKKQRQDKREAEEFANLKYLNHDPHRQIRYFIEKHGIQKGLKQHQEWMASNALKMGLGIAAGRADAIKDDDDDLLNETL